MALPSQSGRTSSTGRTYMARKGKPKIAPFVGASVAVGVLAVAGWALTRKGEGHEAVTPPLAADRIEDSAAMPAAPAPAANTQQAVPPRQLAMDSQAEEPALPPVLELRQGRGETAPETPKQASSPVTTPQVIEPPVRQVQAGPPPAPPHSATPSGFNSSLPTDLGAKLSAAKAKETERDLVAARFLYSQALADPRLPESDKATIRNRLGAINDELIFSPRVARDDPYSELYTVQPNDSLIRIAQKLKLAADWRLLQRINRMSDPGRLTLDQKLKVIRHPFHVVVHKSAYRADVYLGPAERPEQWVYVKSFRVGLGEGNTTPLGTFTVRKGSKMVKPPWTNPRTGEQFGGGETKNPIGMHWIGIEGQGEAAAYAGYGLHGTIEPESIGQQRSMGCVRMLAEDIALMYELLTEQGSQIQIRP